MALAAKPTKSAFKIRRSPDGVGRLSAAAPVRTGDPALCTPTSAACHLGGSAKPMSAQAAKVIGRGTDIIIKIDFTGSFRILLICRA
jgi:hypothetical protein